MRDDLYLWPWPSYEEQWPSCLSDIQQLLLHTVLHRCWATAFYPQSPANTPQRCFQRISNTEWSCSSVTDLHGCEAAVAGLQAVSLLIEGGDVHRSDHWALSLTLLSGTLPLTGVTHTGRRNNSSRNRSTEAPVVSVSMLMFDSPGVAALPDDVSCAVAVTSVEAGTVVPSQTLTRVQVQTRETLAPPHTLIPTLTRRRRTRRRAGVRTRRHAVGEHLTARTNPLWGTKQSTSNLNLIHT